MMRVEHLASGIIILAMMSVSIYGTYVISADTLLPIHWSIRGEADHYVARDTALILMPVMGVILSMLFIAIPFIDPRKENVRRNVGLYYVSWFGPLCVILITHVAIVLSAAKAVELSPYTVLVPTCFLVIVLGNYMTKSRSSWFIGLRTPWSLMSERAWIAANRVAGRLFVITGLFASVAAVSINIQWGFSILTIGLPISALIGVAISYEVWRQDPDRAQL